MGPGRGRVSSSFHVSPVNSTGSGSSTFMSLGFNTPFTTPNEPFGGDPHGRKQYLGWMSFLLFSWVINKKIDPNKSHHSIFIRFDGSVYDSLGYVLDDSHGEQDGS